MFSVCKERGGGGNGDTLSPLPANQHLFTDNVLIHSNKSWHNHSNLCNMMTRWWNI